MSSLRPLFMGVDLGTTAVKCAVYLADGTAVGETTLEYALLTPAPDWVEVPVEVYWNAFAACVHSLLGKPQVEAGRIRSLAISAQGETFVPVDASGEPVRNAIVWLDNRAHQQATAIAEEFGNDQIYRVTGQPEMLPSWPAAKIAWLTENEPTTADRTARYLLIADYFIARLTGEYVTEGSTVTSTCYWDFRTKRWWPAMMDFVRVSPDQLPTLLEPASVVGVVRPNVASELGLPSELIVCTGGLDQACASVGGGCVEPGTVSEATGAAVAICAPLRGPALDPAGAMPCHYHVIPDRYMFHTFTAGGIVLRWFRDQFCEVDVQEAARSGRSSYDILGDLANEAPAGADGLVMLPHLQGAMAPENNGLARGALVGLSLHHGRGHVVRAIMESVAFVVRRNVEVLGSLGVEVSSVHSLGGGARSPVWKQIEADVLGVPVVTTAQADAACLGAAMLAAVAVGEFDDVECASTAMVATGATFEPNLGNKRVYDDTYGAYVSAYDQLVPIFMSMHNQRVARTEAAQT